VFINNNDGAVVRTACSPIDIDRTIVILAIETSVQDKPFVPKRERVALKDLGNNAYRSHSPTGSRASVSTSILCSPTHEIVAYTEDNHGTRVTYYVQGNILAPKYSRRMSTEWRHDIFNFCSLVSTKRAAVSLKMDNTALIDIIVNKEEPAKVWPRGVSLLQQRGERDRE